MRLPLREWGILLHAVVWLWVVNVGLRSFDYARLRSWLRIDEKQLGPRTGQFDDVADDVADDLAADLESSRRLHYLVAAATHLCPWESRCLARSMVLNLMLAAQGIPSQVCFGVSVEPGDFEAHAWVEVGGHPIGESAANRDKYAPFDGRPVTNDRA